MIGAVFTEKMIARNRIFRVAGPFLLSVLAFKCKALFKWRPPFPRPVSQRALFLSLIALSCSLRPSLRPLRPLIAPVSPLDSPFAPPPPFSSFFPHPRTDIFLPPFSLSRRFHAAETPLGQEASFPDIQMRSNIIPGHRAPLGGAAPRFPRG